MKTVMKGTKGIIQEQLRGKGHNPGQRHPPHPERKERFPLPVRSPWTGHGAASRWAASSAPCACLLHTSDKLPHKPVHACTHAHGVHLHTCKCTSPRPIPTQLQAHSAPGPAPAWAHPTAHSPSSCHSPGTCAGGRPGTAAGSSG